MKAPRLLLLLGLLTIAAGIGAISARRVEDQLAVIAACDAAQRGDWTTTLARSQGRSGAGETGRAAAECRCAALLATDHGPACVALLEEVLADPEADGWAPHPPLAIHLIQTWRDAGHTQQAAELARRAARLYPENPDLFYLELLTRAATEDEEAVLEELTARVPANGAAAVRMRVSLANRHLLRGDPPSALRVLGDSPPRDAGAATSLWFETRGLALAQAGDLAGVERQYRRWRDAGGDPEELNARFALTLSIGGLHKPGHPTRKLLEDALRTPHEDAKLDEALTLRLILSLVQDGLMDEALATFERGRERFALEGLTREELERAAVQQELASLPATRRRGRVRFELPALAPGARLLVSPDSVAPVDAAYEAHPARREIELTRELGPAPLRWVLQDATGATVASGTRQPRAGKTTTVRVVAGDAQPRQGVSLSRQPADGRRRVALVLLDCGDWRIVQYLRARGELPVLSALLEQGQRAVLLSDPPLTAAALESLVWPGRSGDAGFVGLLHRFGTELAGLASVGENPLAGLDWLLPEQPDLFSVVGAGPLTAANLLFAHGGIQAGRHSETTGPGGLRQRIPLPTSSRDLDPAERAAFPTLAGVIRERDAIHLRTIAAEFDVAEDLVREGSHDFFALRIEPLDLLTHAHFSAAVRDGQDDGRGLLFSVYRYMDARLGRIHPLLDADDILIVMSDHGIRTAMEHSRFAFFVAAGAGVPHSRAEGTPALRGVSRAVADLLQVETDWPDTGVAPWARSLASLAPQSARAHPAPAVR